jgi:hypothetical protein
MSFEQARGKVLSGVTCHYCDETAAKKPLRRKMSRKILLFLPAPLRWTKQPMARSRHFASMDSRFFCVLFFLTLNFSRWTPIVQGDEFRSQDRFFKQLAQPVSLVLEGKSFRETILKVAQQHDVNIWLDRYVDPSRLVAPGQLGPNLYLALAKVSALQDCVVMPVANVVLVGREAWVDATAAALIPTAKTAPKIDLHWQQLTTPREALSTATGMGPEQVLALPHDLWPAVSLKAISRPVATNLVLSQFGRRLHSPNQIDLAATAPLSKQAELLLRSYTNDESLLAAAKSLTPSPVVVAKRPIAALNLTAKQHRLLTAALMTEISKNNVAAPRSIDERKFDSLKFKDAKIADVLNQLAAVAKMKCVFVPEAQELSQQFISLDVADKSLRQLIEIVAEKGSLQVQWSESEFQLAPQSR